MAMATFLPACDKNDELKTENRDKGIIGEWSWVNSRGGFTGTEYLSPGESGIEKIMRFRINDTVDIFENDVLVQHTDYYLSREESIILHDTFDFVTINYKYRLSNPDSLVTIPMRYMILELSDVLFIDEDVYDGYEHLYKRE